MKKGTLFKITATLVATVLVTTSVLVYVDKTKANASSKVTKKNDSLNSQLTQAINGMEKKSVKGDSNSKLYTVKMNGQKVTYKVTETSTGRKVIQTNNKTNEYVEYILDNDTMSTTIGEVVDGKYVTKNSNKTSFKELTAQAQNLEQSDSSNRVSCLSLGKSLWYEKNDNIMNIGKSKSGIDIEKFSINLSELNDVALAKVSRYHKDVYESAKYFENAKLYFEKAVQTLPFQVIFLFISFILKTNIIPFTIASFAPVLSTIFALVATVVFAVCLLFGLGGIICDIELIRTFVMTMAYGIRAESTYNKIVPLGIAY